MARAIRLGTPLDKCEGCKKDWTKCGRCPVNIEWLREQKAWISESGLSNATVAIIEANKSESEVQDEICNNLS